jgi:hypothetical protein
MVVRISDPHHPDYGCEHSFTGREFEGLHPRMEVARPQPFAAAA